MTAPPNVPDDLGVAGADLFARIVDDLDDGLVFDALELDRLHRAARLEDKAAAMRADISARGLWVDSLKGEIPNPMLLRLESIEKTIANLLSRLTVARPTPKTGHLSRAQRNRLRDFQARGAM
jgi:hypothetical protein